MVSFDDNKYEKKKGRKGCSFWSCALFACLTLTILVDTFVFPETLPIQIETKDIETLIEDVYEKGEDLWEQGEGLLDGSASTATTLERLSEELAREVLAGESRETSSRQRRRMCRGTRGYDEPA